MKDEIHELIRFRGKRYQFKVVDELADRRSPWAAEDHAIEMPRFSLPLFGQGAKADVKGERDPRQFSCPLQKYVVRCAPPAVLNDRQNVDVPEAELLGNGFGNMNIEVK